MASTYSNLKLQLMGTGENSGTWGTITNVNLGTALEEAIVGSADVTFSSGTVTLTLTDTNSSQTARNLRLNLTGTSGGAQNLIVPGIEKAYLVNNGCADAITVKNATGTGIAVPAGKTMWVYNTGSNVVDAVTHLTSLTLEAPLPVASGGTGSNSATFSGANITALNASSVSSGTLANARTTAASANGASTIVARDASGNFSANTITANVTGSISGSAATLTTARNFQISGGATAANVSFNGSAAVDLNVTAMNASVINTGTLANARTTAASANGASTIVARDGSGNFAANTITANLTGLASNATFAVTAGNATNATNATTAINATSATQIINAGSFNITVSGTKLLFSYNGATVASLDSNGNFTTLNNITAYGTP